MLRWGSLLRPTGLCRRVHNNTSSVIGADVPSFSKFPYRATDVLHLYRDFWRLVLRYPENERHDLVFRLRNEFRSKRHLGHPRMVTGALRRGQALLEMYKGRIEYRESKPDRRAAARMIPRLRGQRTVDAPISLKSAVGSASPAWEHLQEVTAGTLPGLRHHSASRALFGASPSDVYPTGYHSSR